VKATCVQTVAFDAKCNQTGALFVGFASAFGHTRWGTFRGTVAAFSTPSGQKEATKTRQGDGFFDRRLRYVSPFEIATIFAATRQPEKALDWLDGAIYERSQPITFLQRNPTFAGLRRSRARQVECWRSISIAC
jgi:hypothetical protein